MRKLISSLLVIVFGLFLVSSVNLKANGPLVEAIDGASIREKVNGEIEQGLRFYAKLNGEADEHGFYLVFGEATVQQLKDALIEQGQAEFAELNGKDVYRVDVPGVTQEKEYSVVLTGIPGPGYLQNISVFPYAVVGEEETIVDSVTRSVGEVALKAANAGEDVGDVIDELETNFKRLGMNAFGELELTGNMFETNHFLLREEFIKDWNAKFGTGWTELVGSAFHASATAGSVQASLANSNLYKFFRDSKYEDKWAFILDIMIEKGAVWPRDMAQAIKGDGTITGQSNVYGGNHLNYSIANFFNQSNVAGGFTPINFTGRAIYNDVKNLIEGVYISLQDYEFYKPGDQFEFEIATVKSGYNFVNYKLGEQTYLAGTQYEVTGSNVVIELIYDPINYNVEFYLEDEIFEDYTTTYTIESGLILDPLVEEGYAFEGWYDNPGLEGTPVISIPKGSTGNKAFYAKATQSEFVIVDVTFDLNGGSLNNHQSLIDYRTKTTFVATRYSTAGDNGGLDLTVGTSRGGLYWHVMAFKETGINKVYELIGKGSGYTNEEADIYISFHDNYSDKQRMLNLYNPITLGHLVVIPWLPSAVTGATEIDLHFMPVTALTMNVSMELQEPEEDMIFIPVRDGANFLGWYLDDEFEVGPIEEYPGYRPADGVTEVTYYAKWEILDFKVTYDFGEYGYISDETKQTFFAEFVADYKEYYGRTATSIQDLIDNFAAKSYIPGNIKDIFQQEFENGKWTWMLDYFMAKAVEEEYDETDKLQAWNQTTWRTNIEAFFNNKQFNYAGASDSMDFTNSQDFWKYTSYNKTVEDFVSEGALFDGSTITSWNDDYEFEGWYSDAALTNKVTQLPKTTEANIIIYAKWVEK